MRAAPACPYCGAPAELELGAALFPAKPDLAHHRFWICAPCGARVGCHPGTQRPLGTMADAPLRAARVRVHAAMDPLWRSGSLTRAGAYAWLAAAMGVPVGACHVGALTLDQCAEALRHLAVAFPLPSTGPCS